MDGVQVADEIIGGVGSIALEAAEIALIARFPFLGLPIIKQIWEFFASQLAAEAIKEMKKGSTTLIITFKNEENNKAAKDAAEKLKVVQDDPASTSGEKSQALEDFRRRYSDLIRQRPVTKV